MLIIHLINLKQNSLVIQVKVCETSPEIGTIDTKFLEDANQIRKIDAFEYMQEHEEIDECKEVRQFSLTDPYCLRISFPSPQKQGKRKKILLCH